MIEACFVDSNLPEVVYVSLAVVWVVVSGLSAFVVLAVEVSLVVTLLIFVVSAEVLVLISGLSVVVALVVEVVLVVAIAVLVSVVRLDVVAVDAKELVVGTLVVAANTQSSLSASYVRPESQ